MTRSTRLLPAFVALALAATLAACSTTGTATGDATRTTEVEVGAYPVTIEHALGSTTVSEEPERVATIGSNEHDFVLALGVVPVGASKVDWGGNDAGSTPWFDERLTDIGGEQPQRYDDADGVAIEEIAALDPDLILSTYWDLSKRDYRRLSEIAPVVAYPEAPYTTPWQTSLEMIGQALGRPALAAEVREQTEQTLADVAAEHPELTEVDFTYLGLTAADTSTISYLTPLDPRVRVLEAMGLETAPAIRRLSQGNETYYGSVSAERAGDLDADLALVMPLDDLDGDGLRKLMAGDPLLSRIPPYAAGAWYPAVDPTKMLSLSGASPLSLPWAVDHVVPEIAAVARDAA